MPPQNIVFHPKILTTFKGYSSGQFLRDAIAGVIVGIVALPLAIAFGIASGVTPEKGIITAVIAGFLISCFGGSRVQIGGPTGAFIVIVYGIIQKHGLEGLTIATMMAGVILIVMGIFKAGNLIKFIPAPLVVGFTSGIALVIFSSQMQNLFGFKLDRVPAEFVEQWSAYMFKAHDVNLWALAVGIFTIAIITVTIRFYPRLPGAFFALIITTVLSKTFELPLETIGSRFGELSMSIPAPTLPNLDFSTMRSLLIPAFTIAILAAIESLLSALVADGMIGGKHRSNTELIAQGLANVVAPLFGGIPATGAIARTVTNVRNGGRTPVAGMIHALTLMVIVLYAGQLARWIPMATLAGILIVVAYNMSEWREFRSLLKSRKSDISIMLVTFAVTVLVDLSVAIQIGMVLSAFLFMHRMAQESDIEKIIPNIEGEENADTYYDRGDALHQFTIPAGVEVFEAHGAFFFGAADKFEHVLRQSASITKCIVLRMNNIYVLDATGVKVLSRVAQSIQAQQSHFIIAELNPGCLATLQKAKAFSLIGRENVVASLKAALDKAANL